MLERGSGTFTVEPGRGNEPVDAPADHVLEQGSAFVHACFR